MGIERPRRRLGRLLLRPLPNSSLPLTQSLPSLALLFTLLTVLPAQAANLSILSQNMNRLFDDIDDGKREPLSRSDLFRDRVNDAAARFADDFGLPQIIALQEVENVNVLRRIAARIRQRHGVDYRALLISGQQRSIINTGFLVRAGVDIQKTQQLFRERVLQRDSSPLFSRPPLLLEACYLERCLTLVNLHLRSMRGIDSTCRGERVARKRQRQAEAIAAWVHRFQQIDPAAKLMLLGDFNALTPADRHVDVAGILLGNPDNSRVRLLSRDLVDPDLVDLTRAVSPPRRFSYIFSQRRQQLDYMFASRPLATALQEIAYSRIDYAFSDHAGLLARFDW